MCSGKENILVFACDCSTEALERATEVIYASNVVSAERRFRPFCWDISACHFPKWLICDSCHETSRLKQNMFLSGGWHYFYMHISSYTKLYVSFANFLSDFDDNERDCTDIISSKESDCCIGGVDYVTLVCSILSHILLFPCWPLSMTFLLQMYTLCFFNFFGRFLLYQLYHFTGCLRPLLRASLS